MYYVEQANARSVTVAGPNKDGDALKAESFMTGFRVAASTDHGDHFTSQTRFAFGSAYLTDLGRPIKSPFQIELAHRINIIRSHAKALESPRQP
jgi:hypothetical protein